MSTIGILGMIVNNRADQAPKVQEVLTKHGQMIMSRVGIPSTDRYEGIITLTLNTAAGNIENLAQELGKIPGVQTNYCMLKACEEGKGFCQV